MFQLTKSTSSVTDWVEIPGEPVVSHYQLVSSVTSEKKYLIASGNSGTVSIMTSDGGAVSATVSDGKIASADSDAVWTFTASGSGYYIQDANGKYMYPYAQRSGYWQHSLLTEQNSGQVVTVGSNATQLYRTYTQGKNQTTS